MGAERHIEKIRSLDLELSETSIDYLSTIMGKDLWTPATEDEIRCSQEWRHGPVKRKMEKVFALAIAKSGGRYFVEWAKNKIEKIDGNYGYHHWQVGFFSLPKDIIWSSSKVRTMVEGAERSLNSPFDETSFGRKRNDNRILEGSFPRFLRRTGLDGLTEVVFGVPNGDRNLVGARPYNQLELEGTRILWELCDDSDLNPPSGTKKFLEDYPRKIGIYKPMPAIFGPLAAFEENIGHITRMFGDVAYLERANPLVDFRLLGGSVFNRMVRGTGAK